MSEPDWEWNPDTYLAEMLEEIPDTVDDQLAWLEEAGLRAEARYVRADLAVMIGIRAGSEDAPV